MDIIGIGVDLVYIPKIQKLTTSYGNRFLNKVFTLEEINCAFQKKNIHNYLSSAFAAKEAFFKAIGGYSPFVLKEISLVRDQTGKPVVNLYGKAKEIFEKLGGKKILVSISHEKEYTICVIILLGNMEKEA